MDKKTTALKRGRRCIQLGGAGAAIALICCFTPALVVLLGALGLGVMIKYLDLILLPALFICLGLLAYGLRLRKAGPQAEKEEGLSK